MIGDLIREARSKQGISVRELARRTGVSASYISDLENGNMSNPSLKVLTRINKGLGVTLVNENYLYYIENRKKLIDLAKDIAAKNCIDIDFGDPFDNIEREMEVYFKIQMAIIKALKELK